MLKLTQEAAFEVHYKYALSRLNTVVNSATIGTLRDLFTTLRYRLRECQSPEQGEEQCGRSTAPELRRECERGRRPPMGQRQRLDSLLFPEFQMFLCL